MIFYVKDDLLVNVIHQIRLYFSEGKNYHKPKVLRRLQYLSIDYTKPCGFFMEPTKVFQVCVGHGLYCLSTNINKLV